MCNDDSMSYGSYFMLQDDSVQRFDNEATTAASKAFGIKEADVDEINNKILTALKLSSKSGPSIDASANSGESITQKRQNECVTASKSNHSEEKEPKTECPRDQPSDSNDKKDSEDLEEWLDDFLG